MKRQTRGRSYYLRHYDRPLRWPNPNLNHNNQRKMSVHYKFKAALDFSTVTFDGIHISVSELKKSIIDQKRLGKNADFDLQIINAQTKEVYSDENALIPKNTSVIVARVPITDKKKSGPPMSKDHPPGRGMHHHKGGAFHQQSGAEVAKGSDLSSMDLSEEEKIKAMMTQSTADYDPSHYVRIRGANQHGRVPDNYRCNKCNQGGHWIKHCPNAPNVQPDVKKSTGIPRSFMVVVDSPDFPGALMTPEGRYAVPAVDHAAYLEKNKGQQTVEQPSKPKIPDDLVCTLCNDLLTDALLVPCCANSYCDDCIRSYLLESEHECPGCHEKDISPNSLIPNRFLRGTVNAFKNETGYSKPEKVPERAQKPSPKAERPKEEPRKLSLDELPDDLFPHSPKKIDSENETGGANDIDSTKDLYDFNDGSIPSPFASPKRTEPKVELPPVKTEHRAIQSLTRSFPGGSHPPPHGGMRGPPSGPPPQQHHAPPPHHMARKPLPPPPGSSSAHEPPPPGFDVPPPGEDASHRPPPNGGHDNGPRDSRGPSSGPPPPQQQQQPSMSMPPGGPPPTFNPLQPPPGYPSGPPPPHGPPGMPPGIPPPGFGPPHGSGPNMPPNSFNRLPPPMNRGPPPMHQGPPPRYHMDQDDFGHRGRGRRPYPHDHRDEENRPGVIDDPLKEFERLMREKDRRKKMAASGGPRKRSKSRSFSPSPRRTSPYPPKRSRSRSFSRSPSPKRKRPLPGPKRRRSYSRSPSRTPPPMRRLGKSRSRSRNRSLTPTPPGKLRRSPGPRRAPPQYSPSPPPSRFNRKDKDEYFERGRDRDRDRDRYDDRPSSRFPAKSSYSSRDYDQKYDAPPPSKYDNAPLSKLDPHKYDSQRPPLRPYHGHPSHGGMPLEPPPSGYRDKPPLMEANKRPYDYEPNIVPPGTEPIVNPPVPSIMDINVNQPHPNASNVYQISTIGGGSGSASGGSGHHHHHHHDPHGRGSERERSSAETEKGRRDARETELAHHHHPSSASASSVVTESKKSEDRERDKDHQDGDKDKRKKSPVGKKHKKDKKKHKKKSKEEKEKKVRKERKKSKDSKSGEGEKSSDDNDDQETELRVRGEKAQVTNGSNIGIKAEPLAALSTEDDVKHGVLGHGGTLPTALMVGTALPLENQVVVDSSIVAAKQTAPCDSTVKSPDRVLEMMMGDPTIMLKDEQGLSGEKIATVETVKRRDSVASQSNGNEVPDKKSSENQPATADELRLHLPPSKWDEFEDYNSGGGEPLKLPAHGLTIPGIGPLEQKREHVERTVTSEVLKRAELAIFDKPMKVSDPLKPLSPEDIEMSRKYDKDLPLQSIVVQNVKPDLKTSSVVSAVSRKSAKDRLGSKLSEDEVVLNVSKTIESSSAVSIKSKVSAVRENVSGDRRRRSRSRSPAYASGSRYHNRSRSRSVDKPRNRSRHSSERQQKLAMESSRRQSPGRKPSPSGRSNQRERERRRSPSRERRRSASRERRRSGSREKRRSMSRERRRSPSREKRSTSKTRDRSRRRTPTPPSRERKKSVSRERERTRRSPSRERRTQRSRSRDRERERKRSNSRTRRRSKSRERRRSREREPRRRSNSRPRRSRSPEKRRSPSRDRTGRRRSTSRERDQFRGRQRSPFKRPGEASRGKDDLREMAAGGRGREPSEKIRLNLLEERKEHIPHSSRSSDPAKQIDEPPSPEARVFQTGGGGSSRSGQVFSPTLKKQKGRINIKLSSISKTEQQQSGSSSSDEDHDGQDHPEGKSTDSGDEKKRKKRRHSSTSTKSSSSSDNKRKKKKKEKKKKKKKKKSK